MAMPVLRSRSGRGSLTRLVTAVGRSRMIAAANRSCAASDLSGPMSRARPNQLTQSIAITVTIVGGSHQYRISTRPMMPTSCARALSNTPPPAGRLGRPG